MVFSSLVFLFAFFPLSLFFYVIMPSKRSRNVVLLLFSLIFYAWGEPKYVLLLMFMAFSSWLCALGVDKAEAKSKKRLFVVLAAVIDIALIGYFKYAGLVCSLFGPVPEFIQNIALPIGISFYTFQLLTYVVDVYRGEAPAQKSYWNVLLYAALFHQCIAGPIVRYKTIDEELFSDKPRKPDVVRGVSRFCGGLAKKVLLANPCGALADKLLLTDAVLADASQLAANLEALGGISVLGAWLGIFAYGLQIYLDFSAYSDMAIGMGKMIGLNYLENFDYPYISRTVTEFWRRWHMSLSTFFRDYVYIPLGGNRKGIFRSVVNTFIVWALTGLWHGASWNFVVWGLWFFVFLMIERLFLKKVMEHVPLISNAYLLFVVLLGWVIFRFADMQILVTFARSLFGANGNALTDFTSITLLQSNAYLLAVCVIASTPVMRKLKIKLEKYGRKNKGFGMMWNVGFYSVLPVILLLLSAAALVGDSYNPFIYFQF